MNKTFIPVCNFDKKRWYIINCKNEHLGRVSSSIIPILIGKIKPYYFPSIDIGNYVILINIESILFDTKRDWLHVFSPGNPGTSLKKIKKTYSNQIIRNCIYKMLPNGPTKRNLRNRLKIYKGSQHPYRAQCPIYIDNIKNI